jgi:hypothetical protein
MDIKIRWEVMKKDLEMKVNILLQENEKLNVILQQRLGQIDL